MNISLPITEHEMIKAINHTEIFSGISSQEKHALVQKIFVCQANEGDIIIEQGEESDRLYMIIHGHVLVYIKKNSQGWQRINRLGPNEVFGEIGVLRKIKRTARIVAEGPCTFLSINADDFLQIYQSFSPKTRDNIQIFISKRLVHHKHFTD